jgi:hypothetical protein
MMIMMVLLVMSYYAHAQSAVVFFTSFINLLTLMGSFLRESLFRMLGHVK